MKRHFRIIILALILLILLIRVVGCLFYKNDNASFLNDMDSVPNWVTDVLCLSTFGTEQSPDQTETFLNQYVCTFDFDTDHIFAVQVASDSTLLKETGAEKYPVVWTHKQNDDIVGSVNSAYEWRVYSVLRINQHIENDKSVGYSVGNASQPNSSIYLDSPLALLGVEPDGLYYDLYYLEYAINEKDSLAINLVYEDVESRMKDTQKEIIYQFPIDFNFGSWAYSISENGKVAFSMPLENQIVVSDGQNKWQLEREYITSESVAWLKDGYVLYCESCISPNSTEREYYLDYHLMVWNIETGETKPLVDYLGIEDEFIFGNMPYELAINDTGNLLACLYASGYGSHDYKILFYNLETGEHYVFEPWLNEASGIMYSVSSNGIYFCEPQEQISISPKIVWYSQIDN